MGPLTLVQRVAPVLRLTRVTGGFAAVANAWFVIFWSRAAHQSSPNALTTEVRDSSLQMLLIGAAMNAVGLYSYAASLNDILDARRDRTLHPGRPIPAHELSVDWAAALSFASLIFALVGAVILGREAVLVSLLVAACVLVFHAFGKFIPAVGLVLVGLIFAGQMLTPNVHMSFLWPAWLIMTHTLVLGVVCHIVGRRVPPLSQRSLWAVTLGWLFWTCICALGTHARTGSIWPTWVATSCVYWIVGLAAFLAIVIRSRVRAHGVSVRAAEKVARYGALWTSLYACAWLFGQGYTTGGWFMLALAAAGFVGMTVLREMYAMIEQPLDYRR